MNRTIKLLIGASLLTPILVLGTVTAVEDQTATTNTTPTTTVAEKDPQALQERLNKRKTELKTKLTNAEQARLKLRCKASQGVLKSVEGRIKGIETSREHVYHNLGDRLTKLSEKLKERDLDTTELDAEIATLKAKGEVFKTDLSAYKQAVADLAEMDCVADPTAFKASLESARALREKLVTSGKDIKAYVNDTIKPTLKDLRSQLGKTENSTEGGDN